MVKLRAFLDAEAKRNAGGNGIKPTEPVPLRLVKPAKQVRYAWLCPFCRKAWGKIQSIRDPYRFEVASVMAWLIQLPAARIASAINSAAKIVTAASSVALVCPCNCFACSRSWVSVGIDQDPDSGSRQSLSALWLPLFLQVSHSDVQTRLDLCLVLARM